MFFSVGTLIQGLLLVVHVSALSKNPDCSAVPLKDNDICNTQLIPAQRAAALTAAMTVEEKVGNLVNNATGAPRLGFPPYEWWSEALHGLGFSDGIDFGVNFSIGAIPSGEPFTSATSFANPILLAAAFDDKLIQDVAAAISTEARAFNNFGRAGLDFWTPNINPYRDPRWGRGMETPGEDPLRVMGYVKAFVEGLEGPKDALPKKTLATCKHFAGYDLERVDNVTRHTFDAIIIMQDLVEYYLPPFRQCARDSNVGSIMCSYNSLNGTPACADDYLLDKILRQHWNWTAHNNYIVTDCGVLQYTYEQHNYTDTAAEAVSVLFAAGTDNICSASSADVLAAYEQLLLPEAQIDLSLNRLLEALIRLGLFDPVEGNPYAGLSWDDVNSQATQDLARYSAAQSVVMLKNDGTLPLDVTNTSVAMIGAWANATWALLGNYFGVPPFYHGPLYAVDQLGASIHYASGADLSANTTDSESLQMSVDAAMASDIVFYFGGTNLAVESEDNDRESIAYGAAQLEEIERVCALGKPCIITQFGDHLDSTLLLQNPNMSAILWAGYPGQDGGSAVLDVITGKVAPAARLPVTQYPAGYIDQIALTDMTLRPAATHPGRTYMFYDEAVVPFGFGLHYTTFSASFRSLDCEYGHSNGSTSFNVSDVLNSCASSYVDLCPFGNITIDVTNTGDVTSDFVALLFSSGQHGPQPYPLKKLAAYTRIANIAPQETVSAVMQLTLGSLARVNDNGDTILYSGEYQLLLDTPVQDVFSLMLSMEDIVLDHWVANI